VPAHAQQPVGSVPGVGVRPIRGQIAVVVVGIGIHSIAGELIQRVVGVVRGCRRAPRLMKDALRAWQEELAGGADYDTVIVTGGPVIGPLLAPQLNHGDVRIIPEGEAHPANTWGSLRHRGVKREYTAR
jgi:hypothetical protein